MNIKNDIHSILVFNIDNIGGKWKASTSFRTEQMYLHPTIKQRNTYTPI